MKKLTYILFFALWTIGFSACKEDNYMSSVSGEEVQVSSLKLRLSDVMSKDMNLSRAGEDKPALYNLYLYIFANGTRVSEPVNIPSQNISSSTSTSGETHDYEIKNVSLKMMAGENTVYALGNTENGYYNNALLNELAEIDSENAFIEKLFSINAAYETNQSLPVSLSNIFMTGRGTISVTGNQAEGVITLKRPVASINMKVKTITTNAGNAIEFIPQTYQIYNISQQALVIADPQNTLNNVVRTYYDTKPFTNWVNEYQGSTVVAKNCQFYLPENIQELKTLSNYHQRDLRKTDDRSWVNAPANSTYVVISGNYTEKNSEGVLVNQGTTSYTIHLGDFSETKTGSWGNFSVERNARYSYTITIQGIENIKVEAEKEEGDGDQPGAEGIIIGNESASEIFDLDCTYEQMLVTYNLNDIVNSIKADKSSLSNDEKIANAFILKTSSPFDESGSGYIRPYAIEKELNDDRIEKEKSLKDKMDYKWVWFLSQDNNSALSDYPGESEKNFTLIDPYNLCVKLGKLVSQLVTSGNITDDQGITVSSGKVYFTAFVDEYYYDKNPITNESVSWAEFTRQNDRTMIIASDMSVSPDGHSIYAKARTSISQRSMQTFYDESGAKNFNALGLEVYCENDLFMGYDQNTWKNKWTGKATNESNGRYNMKNLMGFSGNQSWSYFVRQGRNGYLSSGASLTHKIGKSNDNLVNAHPFYACLSRNRDLDGNGRIEDNEIRWYLPSCDQYARLQVGNSSMSDESKLFKGNKSLFASQSYPADFLKDGALYYTSTYRSSAYADNRQLLWAAEVGAFGARKEDQNDYKTLYKGFVRCVRNLPSETVKGLHSTTVVGDEALGASSYDEAKNNTNKYLFDFTGRLDSRIFRTVTQRGPYQSHYEEPVLDNMSDLNRLPQGLVVARKDVSSRTYAASRIWNATSNPCANYTETSTSGQTYLGYWRVPNLREMMVISARAKELGLVDSNLNDDNYVYYAISTSFSGHNDDQPGFSYNATSGFVTVSGGSQVKVRCVRDMINGE